MSFSSLFAITLAITLVVTVSTTRILLPVLRRHHMGQRILAIGPAWHRQKEGTPTMGGLAFLPAVLLSLGVSGLLYAKHLPAFFWRPLLLTLLFAMANAAVGVVDDLTKFRKEQNEGLSPVQKLVLQITFASAYIALLRLYGHVDSGIYIPFLNTVWELGPLYYPFSVLLCVGVVNCVNLADGVDGLCSSTSAVLGCFFVVAATLLAEGSALLCATALIGVALGFLFFNRHPAKIFMGDTGSLFLGSMAVGCGFLIDNPLILLVAGGVFIFEGISVILQVSWYKMTGKRLFRMAPFHHHLEKCGMSETGIVLLFIFIATVLGALALLGLS